MSNLNDEDNQEKKVDSLKKEGEKELSTEEKLKEAEEKLLRTLAELENQRKRFDKEIKDAIDFGGFSFAKENLVILDNLQRAYISIKEDPVLKVNKDIDKFLNNIEVIEKDLISIFKKNRIEKIDTKNKKFDPNLHQAMSETEDDSKDTGSILQEIQSGYMLGERLLRPSLVSVAKKKTPKKEEKNQKKEDK